MPVVHAEPRPADVLYTREQAAEFLNLKPQTLAAWAMTGRGPAFCKMGRAVRYRRSVLEAYVEATMRGGDSDE
jgi:excisionase family DNA binding protein